MTLTAALDMYLGGAPQGPAGTGKTETVKDLGKNMALFVLVQNCSSSDDISSLGRTFAGLAQAGVWGCFDEFNRISVEVLSVVAQQVQTILDAVRLDETNTTFMDTKIKVIKSVGLFITMNPGYAGRSELPDNLSSLFRPVAMMKADIVAIIKISLMSTGFREADELSKKIGTIYDLMSR
jgi:dynein heavy chain